MGRMKDIYIQTLNETKDLSVVELICLVKKKNSQLGLRNEELLELMNEYQLRNLISEKNILITIKKQNRYV